MESVLCPNCDVDIGEGNSICPTCGWVNISDGSVDNKDAISKLFDPAGENVIIGTDDLSPEQIYAFNSGQALEFLPGDGGMDENGFPIPDIEDIKNELSEENSGIKGKVTKLSKGLKANSALLRIIFTALMAVTAFVLGGVCLYFYDYFRFTDETYQIGYNAVAVVSEKAPQGKVFRATEVYINTGVEMTHCIVYGEFSSDVKEREATYYRLEISNFNPENTILYYAFDEDEYKRLKNGSDEDNIKAGVMKSYYDTYLRYVEEIKNGSYGWKTANSDYINFMLFKNKK